MIESSHLTILDKHLKFLQTKTHADSSIFLVGGCVRDFLLWLQDKPTDIDFTMAGKPLDIYNKISKDGLSHFMTEKFGTITLIKDDLKYELTPLRTESDYDDNRHPGEIVRSNNLLLDSERRDFTINCIYYTNYPYSGELGILPKRENTDKQKQITSLLGRFGYVYLADKSTFILQDHILIEQLFQDGFFQELFFKEWIKSLNPESILGERDGKKDPKNLRFVIDPHQGIQDLEDKKLRAVGSPEKRFQEDALRLLRWLRFVNVCNQRLQDTDISTKLFDFEKATWTALKENSNLLQNIAKERIHDELIKVFSQGNPFAFISLVDEAWLMPFLFPALYATKNIHQPVRYHPFDVYTHTMLTLYELQKINKNYLVRLGMLYHDVGKTAQFAAYADGLTKEEIRAILAWPLNHRKSWPGLTERDFQALGFSKKECEEICRYVGNHHKPEEILDGNNPANIVKKLRKFLSEVGREKIDNILDVTMWDRLGQYNPLQNNSDLKDILMLTGMLETIHTEEGQFTLKDLVINGNDLIKEFNLTPGTIIGELMMRAFDWVINDIAKRNHKNAIIQHLTSYLSNKNNLLEDVN